MPGETTSSASTAVALRQRGRGGPGGAARHVGTGDEEDLLAASLRAATGDRRGRSPPSS